MDKTIDMDKNKEYKKLQKLIRKFHMCMLTTVAYDGTLASRPMHVQQKEADGDLWFFTYSTSEKARHISQNPQVSVSFSDDETNTWVSLSGKAQIVHDATKIDELWNPLLNAWFPDGKETQELTLVKVMLQSAEYWDSPNGLALAVFGSIKAKLTGRPPKAGENETVNLS